MIRNEVTAFRDDVIYQEVCDREYREKEELQMLVDNYDETVRFLNMNYGSEE